LKCFMNPGPVIYYKNYILGIFTNHMNFFLNCIQIHLYRIDKTLLKKVLFPLFKIKKKKHKGKRIKTKKKCDVTNAPVDSTALPRKRSLPMAFFFLSYFCFYSFSFMFFFFFFEGGEQHFF
jgi:hypothetical protein